MEQENQKWNRLLAPLFEYPRERLRIRDIARRSKVPPTTALRYLKQLQREGLLDKEYGVVESNYARWRKASYMINRLFESGLIDFLEERCKPGVIVLFGSVRKGEYEHESDIDLFVEASEQKLNLSPFEKKLGHSIHLVIKQRLRELPQELQLSIMNGIKLSGYLNYGT